MGIPPRLPRRSRTQNAAPRWRSRSAAGRHGTGSGPSRRQRPRLVVPPHRVVAPPAAASAHAPLLTVPGGVNMRRRVPTHHHRSRPAQLVNDGHWPEQTGPTHRSMDREPDEARAFGWVLVQRSIRRGQRFWLSGQRMGWVRHGRPAATPQETLRPGITYVTRIRQRCGPRCPALSCCSCSGPARALQ